ncbi:hypothetical protein scyTo_0006357 [Scyliorhinus torazame]|uniref:Glia maturation factor n=1 Tax=Scyliorhinus torazame TaxID=75743 RepID=A0A401PHD6_SCYTO|nr:hypothetical protein [Scyliorhinus torazame]
MSCPVSLCGVDEQLMEKLKKFRFRKETTNAALIIYSYRYKHTDGRTSYPLCFIFFSPCGCKPEQQMLYAGSKIGLVDVAEFTKVFEIRNTEDFSEEWLCKKLGFFR